jgi:hypothetical protein
LTDAGVGPPCGSSPTPHGGSPQRRLPSRLRSRHLVEGEVYQRRLRDLATAVEAQWTWTEPGPAEMGPGETLAETVARFAAARAATLAWVATLDGAGWRRSGHHATLGTLDVGGLLAVATAHDAEHLATLLAAART